MSARAIHFEIPVDDPDRAIRFYRAAIGWDPRRWGEIPYWTVADSATPEPGIAGALIPRSEAPQGLLLYVSVEDVDAVVKKAEEAGGRIVSPRQAVPGIGWMARINDSEGNLIGLIQEDHAAGS